MGFKELRALIVSSLVSTVAYKLGLALGDGVRSCIMHLLHRQRKEKKPASSLKAPGRTFVVVTTAALPWRTGTSINPMLRAAQLAADASHTVVLVVPWVGAEQQALIYPAGLTFDSHQQQADYILQGE
eukprot:GHRQ01029466.1.p2 GENE.GHRQ01029466.1~~GHRQ01029466.1.p2  ORF type:complete len:128 (+),score=28.87 GHRQ01029466.1:131-514(+)